jgi:hypothetical protein
MLINFKKRSRATLRCLAGRLWPAGRTLPRPALDPIRQPFTYAEDFKTHWTLSKDP